jgi:hypothetical protein
MTDMASDEFFYEAYKYLHDAGARRLEEANEVGRA